MTWSGANNVVLVDNCKNLQPVSLFLEVDQPFITKGNQGFSIQLNAYPQPASKSQGQTLNGFQYVIYVGGPVSGQFGWEIQYWAAGAPSSWPPGYTPDPNTSTQLPALPNDYLVQSFYPAPNNQIPAGSEIGIELQGDPAGGVTGATFIYVDPKKVAHPAFFKFPPKAVYPIYGVQANIVGPGNSQTCEFESGQGFLSYVVERGTTLAAQDSSTGCGGQQPGIGESSNMQYGQLTSSGNIIKQGVGLAIG